MLVEECHSQGLPALNTMLRLLLLTIIAILMGSPTCAWAAPVEAPITVPQFREDLDFLRRTLMQSHPDLPFSSDVAALEAAIRALASDTRTPISQDEAWRRLATLNPLFADGHLSVGFPDWQTAAIAHLREGGTLFPYEVSLDDDGLHIGALLGGAATPLQGARIIAINGEPADLVTAALMQRMHGETALFRSGLLAQRWWFYYWKMYGTTPSYRLTMAQGGRTFSIETMGSKELPLLLRDAAAFDRQFHFAFQPDGSAVLTIATFAPADRGKFLAFTRDAFARLRQAGTGQLTIDISRNGGGDDAMWLDGLMPYLATSAYRTGSTYKKRVVEANVERGEVAGQVVTGSISTWHTPQPDSDLLFKGKTLVAIGPGTYSSAVLFANVMHDFCFGTLVGRGGAARRTQSGGVRRFVLPNSKLVLWVPRFVLAPPVATAPAALLEVQADSSPTCASGDQVAD